MSGRVWLSLAVRKNITITINIFPTNDTYITYDQCMHAARSAQGSRCVSSSLQSFVGWRKSVAAAPLHRPAVGRMCTCSRDRRRCNFSHVHSTHCENQSVDLDATMFLNFLEERACVSAPAPLSFSPSAFLRCVCAVPLSLCLCCVALSPSPSLLLPLSVYKVSSCFIEGLKKTLRFASVIHTLLRISSFRLGENIFFSETKHGA